MVYKKRDIQHSLDRLGVAPKKARGQNFLSDQNGINKVLDFAGVNKDEAVIEIGPGLGAMSRSLAETAGQYVAIEIEEAFADEARNRLQDIPSASVIHSDVRAVRVDELRLHPPARLWTVVSNVPYSVSSEVILWLLEQRHSLHRASLLFQREFSERLAASPGTKEYGSLSVQCQLVADLRLGPRLPGTMFLPSASVESRLVELKFLPQPRYEVLDFLVFREVVRAGFAKRRKTLLNSLLFQGVFENRETADLQLRALELDPERRAETLTGEEFVRLANGLVETRRGKG